MHTKEMREFLLPWGVRHARMFGFAAEGLSLLSLKGFPELLRDP